MAGLALGSNTVDISSMTRTVFTSETKRIRKMDRRTSDKGDSQESSPVFLILVFLSDIVHG